MSKVKALIIQNNGNPLESIHLMDWDLNPLRPTQVLVQMKMAPINPADLNIIEGKYAIKPPLPFILGNEGIGVVLETGSHVTHIKKDDHVIAPCRIGSWCEAYIAEANELFSVPKDIPLEQACMLAINPPTAWRMLHDFSSLKSGDWIIQNAANSAVGRSVIQMSHYLGIKTINMVRRKELIPELEKIGADVVMLDSPLSQSVPDQPLLLGLNAVGGQSALDIAKVLSPHSTLVTYGAMGLKPIQIHNGLLIFKDICIRGFWITDWYRNHSYTESQTMMQYVFSLAQKKLIHIPIASTYALHEYHEAISHAMQNNRSGKILFKIS